MTVTEKLMPNLWWGKVKVKKPEHDEDSSALAGPYFVESECRCDAEEQLLGIAKELYPRAIMLEMYDERAGKPEAYQVEIYSLGSKRPSCVNDGCC